MARRMTWVAIMTAIFAVMAFACAKKSPQGPGALSFTAEGKAYETKEIVFTYLPLGGEDRKFIDIGFDPSRVNGALAAPGASIQWKTRFKTLGELKGKQFDLSRKEFSAHVQFVLGDLDTGLVYPEGPKTFNLEITQAGDGYVSGTFSGEGFVLVGAGGAVKDGVSVTGSFQARVVSVGP